MVQLIQKKTEKRKQKNENQKIKDNLIDRNLNKSIITLNVSSLHIPIKNRDYQNRFKKIIPSNMHFPQETHFTHNDVERLKETGYATYK